MTRSSTHSSSSSSAPSAPSSSRLSLLSFVLLCSLVGVFAGLVTAPNVAPGTWFADLRKPWFNPHKLVARWMWILVYGCIAVAGWRIWKKDTSAHDSTGKGKHDAANRRDALTLWFSQLALNTLWTPLFFGLRHLGLSVCLTVSLLLLIFACIRSFSRVDGTAAKLFWPYAAWIAYASLLNATIWWLNTHAEA